MKKYKVSLRKETTKVMPIEKRIVFNKQEKELISHYAELEFANPEDMVRRALQLLKEEVDRQTQLAQSAELYAELYDQDEEAKMWTNSAMQDWD